MKRTIKKLAYVQLYSQNPAETAGFLEEMFGWETSQGEQGQIYVAVDKYHHRIAIYQRDEPGLKAAGWQVLNKRHFLQTMRMLDEAKVPYKIGTKEECEERKVSEFLSFVDPAGHTAEVVYAPYVTRPNVPYIGKLQIKDLVHLTLSLTPEEFPKMLEFYEQVLKFNVSDLIQDEIAFTRCNENHHTLAMVTSTEPGFRLRHFMFEVENIDDVMKTFYKAKEKKLRTIGIGRHGNCGTTHMYTEMPGMGRSLIEIGWGHKKIKNDDEWEVVNYAFAGEERKKFIDVWESFNQ